jgi:hypothetical protein
MATCYRHLMKNSVSLINMVLFYCILYQFYTASMDMIVDISNTDVVIDEVFLSTLVMKFFKLVHHINFCCVWLVLSHLLTDYLGCKC